MSSRALHYILMAAPLLSLGACAAMAVPPSRSEIGTTLGNASGKSSPGIRVSTGAHWASATVEEDEDMDIGAGYVYERIEAPARDIRSASENPLPLEGRVAHGGYLTFSKIVSRSDVEKNRAWLGLRVEYLHASERQGGDRVGLLTRVDWEIADHVEGAGAASDSCGAAFGAAYGVMGLGVYAEAGAQYDMDGNQSLSATAGVSMRLPFLGGFAFELCGD